MKVQLGNRFWLLTVKLFETDRQACRVQRKLAVDTYKNISERLRSLLVQ